MGWRRFSIVLSIAVSLGIVFGLIEATLWFTGLIPTVRAIIPYAAADAMLIFALTAIITAILAIFQSGAGASAGAETNDRCFIFQSFSGFVSVIMISAAIFLIFVQIFLGTMLSFSIKAILAFIGAISFWVMLTSFISFIITLARRR